MKEKIKAMLFAGFPGCFWTADGCWDSHYGKRHVLLEILQGCNGCSYFLFTVINKKNFVMSYHQNDIRHFQAFIANMRKCNYASFVQFTLYHF